MRSISTKMLLALLVAVMLPLAASAALLALAVDSSFQVGVNERVRGALEQAPIAYRALFDALKDDFEHSTDALVSSAALDAWRRDGDPRPLEAYLQDLLEQRQDLASVHLARTGGEEILTVARDDLGDQADWREWTERRQMRGVDGPVVLEATWLAPREHFEAFQDAGEILDGYETLEHGRVHVRRRYVGVYLSMVGTVLLVAFGLGFHMSRRVTRRIGRLWEATRQVAAGDLSTRVPVGPPDEVGELAAAFNTMVGRLLESRDRIEYLKRVAAWQQLARRLAHEIKNPLTPIQLAVQELRERYKGDDPEFGRLLDQVTEVVTEEVEALRALTTEFSDFARLPAVSPQAVALDGFLEDVRQSLELLQTSRVRLQFEIPRPGVEVHIDRMLMKRALDNLVRNAVQAIEGVEREGVVVVKGGEDSAGAFLCVEDDGPGVPEDERPRVFEPYFTTKREGTGLGLAIVKKIVLEHGGTVAVEDRPGGGARFVVRMPT